MNRFLLMVLTLTPLLVFAASAKEVCRDNGGDWEDGSCVYSSTSSQTPSGSAANASAPSEEETCVVSGGSWTGTDCFYPSGEDECLPETQFQDCKGGRTSSTGPGVCILQSDGVYRCEFFYQQSCGSDQDCADILGVSKSPYVCCGRPGMNRCLNAFLCR
jgi:hypothetical protein